MSPIDAYSISEITDKEDGMTIWLKNEDMVVYYPSKEENNE